MLNTKNDWQRTLSDAALEVLRCSEKDAYARLVVPEPPAGAQAAGLRAKLGALTPQTVVRAPASSVDDAKALLAALWLLHDFLDESHTISQGLNSPTGSYWHAIMHRRE